MHPICNVGAGFAAPAHRQPSCNRLCGLTAAATLSLALLAGTAEAHVVCGKRFFPATLTMDDPGVGDELSLPTVQYLPIPASDAAPGGHSIDYGYEFDKRITEDLGIAINGNYFTQHGVGQNLHGWDNTTLTLKDQLPCSETHEFVASIGVVRELARTGSSLLRDAGAIDSTSFTAPTLYAGKGLGDLPIGVFRPLAVTGELSYQFSDTPSISPNQWNWAVSVQYSMPYLQQSVKALDIPDFLTRFVPLVEIAYSAPAHGVPTGTIAPGLLYEGGTWQAGVEALIPANAATRQGQGVGFIAQFHLYFDDLFPTTLGKPIFGTNLWGR